MFCLRSCLVGFFGFSIAVFRFHAPYAVGWDVHIKITHEHKGDTTYFSLTIGKDGQTSTVSFKASDKAPQMKNSGQKELFELDCGNGFSLFVQSAQNGITFNVIPNAFKVHIVRADGKHYEEMLNAFSGIKSKDVHFIVLVEECGPSQTPPEIVLCTEADLPVLYHGRFESLNIHHPLYLCEKDDEDDIFDATSVKCKFLFLAENDGRFMPNQGDRTYICPKYISVAFSDKKGVTVSTPSCTWISNTVESLAKWQEMKRMIVWEDGRVHSPKETIQNREYFDFIYFWGRNDSGKDLSDRSVLAAVKAVNISNDGVHKRRSSSTVGSGHLVLREKESKPFAIFFYIKKYFPDKDANFSLPKEVGSFTLHLVDEGGSTLKEGYGISVDTSESRYPMYCIFEGK